MSATSLEIQYRLEAFGRVLRSEPELASAAYHSTERSLWSAPTEPSSTTPSTTSGPGPASTGSVRWTTSYHAREAAQMDEAWEAAATLRKAEGKPSGNLPKGSGMG